ncbi:MAG: carboxylating nicotinate-nucleotide diphosphorylase [Muribaculaceae bacterium]|nr:carboxylating nicotinate-nucleotide diphosphorylase [Muribaculaceae bacterium]
MKTKDELIDELLELSFAEDIGDGDHTTLSTIPADAMGRSRLIIKEKGILSGVDIAEKVLHKIDPTIKIDVKIRDGAEVNPGDIAFTAEGPVRALLIAERTMLNIMQRMSGVATMTRKYQDELKGLHTKVLDTRKTTPGMRMLEKEAVATGGGKNHRIGLFDMILIKDNHIDFAGGIEKAIRRAKEYCRENNKDIKIEVEARSLEDIQRILEEGGVDRIMFDNFTPELTKEAVKLVDGRAETESSGGITIENLRAYGETGVDFISVGALTHSVKGLDMSFKAF